MTEKRLFELLTRLDSHPPRIRSPSCIMFEDNPPEPTPFVLDPNDFLTFADFDINPLSFSSRHPSPP